MDDRATPQQVKDLILKAIEANAKAAASIGDDDDTLYYAQTTKELAETLQILNLVFPYS